MRGHQVWVADGDTIYVRIGTHRSGVPRVFLKLRREAREAGRGRWSRR